MRNLIASALLILAAPALADTTTYNTMRIDMVAEQHSKTFAGCTFYGNNLPVYVLWCDGTYNADYFDPPNAGTPVPLGTIDSGFEWFSDIEGECRLHEIVDHGTYKFFHFSCFTDRVHGDGFEDSGLSTGDSTP